MIMRFQKMGSILQVDKEMEKGSVSTTQNQDQNASGKFHTAGKQ